MEATYNVIDKFSDLSRIVSEHRNIGIPVVSEVFIGPLEDTAKRYGLPLTITNDGSVEVQIASYKSYMRALNAEERRLLNIE